MKTIKLYQVDVTAIYERSMHFETRDEFFTSLEDARDYFDRNVKDFLNSLDGVVLEDGEELSIELQQVGEKARKEYWWGNSHWRITLKAIEINI